MAVHVICAVLDSAVAAYNRPFVVPTTGFANRSFADEVNREEKDNPMRNHPEDYSLWHFGNWDDHTGVFNTFDSPILLSKAVDVLVK